MESKFLEVRSKKYQNNIERLVESRQKVRGDSYFDVEHLNTEIRRIFEAMVKVRDKRKVEYDKDGLELYLKSYLPNWTSSLEFYINDLVLYERTNKDSLKVFQDGLFTTQRILFLGDKYANLGYTGNTDPNHVNHALNFLRSFAYPDVILLEAYRKQMPGPFKKGYPFNIALVNSLYLLLDGKNKEASEHIAEKIQIKSISNHKYNSATLMAIKAIADKDEQALLLELNNMLSSQSKIVFPNFIMNYINLEVHSLYNLAGKIWGKSPIEPASEFWDPHFVQYNKEHNPDLLVDFSGISPTFSEWLKGLPENLSMTQLVDEVKDRLSS